MNTGEVCTRRVIVVAPQESIRDAARLMRHHHVGDLVVVEHADGANRPIGILTDRDIVVELLAAGVDMDAVTVGDVMSRPLLTAREQDDLSDTLKRMAQKGVRRIPVVGEDGKLAGLLSIDDLMTLLAELSQDISRLLSSELRHEHERRRD